MQLRGTVVKDVGVRRELQCPESLLMCSSAGEHAFAALNFSKKVVSSYSKVGGGTFRHSVVKLYLKLILKVTKKAASLHNVFAFTSQLFF